MSETQFHPLSEPVKINSLLTGCCSQPHSLLGMHSFAYKKTKGVIVRALIAHSQTCSVIDEQGQAFLLKKTHPLGLYEGFIAKNSFRYRLKITKEDRTTLTIRDPYSFLPTLSQDDIHWFNEGKHYCIYNKLGAHHQTIDGVEGFSFAVWAPSAQRVSLVSDFNAWDGRYHPMRTLGASGIWEIFIPSFPEQMSYKYEILGADGHLKLKSDPYAVYFEKPPHNASKAYALRPFPWKDQEWIQKRTHAHFHQDPISIYEVHIDSWKRICEENNRPFSYRELIEQLVPYAQEMGFTHVEFLPLAEHPFRGSWGYQITGFMAPTHRYGNPHDFMALVDAFHQADIGVIVDWVPAHFPKDQFALTDFDGTHLYDHQDPKQGIHPDWGTLIFNYGRHEVRNFLIASALSWLDRFHIDGLRVDAVASMLYLDYSRKPGEWIPNRYGGKENIEALEFLREVNDLVHTQFPGVLMIAEESTSFGGVTRSTSVQGLGFDFKWNMGWMHDVLAYCQQDAFFRKYRHHQLTFGMLYQYSENFISVFSHDEVVHGKGSLVNKMGTHFFNDKFATLRALYGYQWTWPGKKLLFMGGEIAQTNEWNHNASLDWHLLQYENHQGMQNWIKDLNHWYRSSGTASLDNTYQGFAWINPDDADNSTLSYLRYSDKGDIYLVVLHFTPILRTSFRIGVPCAGKWKEVLNSNAKVYAGTGEGNLGAKFTEAISWHSRPHSLSLKLPPLSALVFKYER